MTSPPASRRVWLALIVVCAGNAALLWFFHDRYWYPTDDGFYAYIAERLMSGDVLNRDVQDIHPGYIHFLHATAFRVFGLDLLSLRYPLIAAAVVQSAFVFALLRERGLLVALAGSIASNALGIVQFMSPTANWYCLPLAFVLAWWLKVVPEGRARLIGAGAILGTLTLFRHLTGIWVAMGVISLVLIERSGEARGRDVILARLQILIMAAGLIGYLALSPETEPGGLLFMGVWPIVIFAWMFVNTRTSNRDVVVGVGQLLLGVSLPTAPLAAYHLAHGSLGILLHDLVAAAAGETQLPFFGSGWYGVLPLAALYQVVSSFDAVQIVNGFYWAVLPAVSAVNGMLLVQHLRQGTQARQIALPMIAVFYAMVALLLEGHLYLYYTVGLSLSSLLWLVARSRLRRAASTALAAALSLVAVLFHAGQTRERTPWQILRGDRVTKFDALVACGLPRCSLRISASDAATYAAFVDTIEKETQPGDYLLTIPNDIELNFLTGRRNPVRFYNAALGITNDDQLREVYRRLEATPPRVVIFRPDDKYNTPATAELMARVKTRYSRLGEIDGAEIYQR